MSSKRGHLYIHMVVGFIVLLRINNKQINKNNAARRT